ncbi:hypothetical protein [Massilia sp. Root351]|uniref:hypothetical protein n=1 Tax=Massilia sp. Root351 TaxID=1736522 RepID=UPI0012F62ECF|nr:hypothetical protein [Massilia sp. Root351]
MLHSLLPSLLPSWRHPFLPSVPHRFFLGLSKFALQLETDGTFLRKSYLCFDLPQTARRVRC